jgi:hypothetical protein
LRSLAIGQVLVLLVILGAPATALADVHSVSPASLPQGATNRPVTIYGSEFERRCATYSVTFSGSGVSATGVARISRGEMTAYVTVATDAPLGSRDVTVSGSGDCHAFSYVGAGLFAVTGPTGTASKLAIIAIDPTSPVAGAPFNVVVQAQNAAGHPTPVTVPTDVVLSLHAGTGQLGGNLAARINGGQSTVTISGVTYSKAESGVVLTASRTFGMSLAPGNSDPFTVLAGAFVRLQVLLPGETAAPRTPSGKTGAPIPQAAGVPFDVTVNAVDASWNVVSSTHVVSLTSSDPNAALPASAALVAGTRKFSITLKTAGTRTVTATDVTDPARTAGTSAPVTVNPGPFVKLQVLVPGESAAPGTASGKTGAPSTQTAGVPFNATVNAVDANWNVTSSTHVVAITSGDPAAILPANAALVAGTRAFAVTLRSVGSWTVTARDVTDAGKTASTSAAIPVVSPAVISLVRSQGLVTYGQVVAFAIQFGANGGNRTAFLEHAYVGSPWTVVATVTTEWSGFATATFAPTRSGYYRVRFAGATDLSAAISNVVLVGVRQTITLRPSHSGTLVIAAGRSITFRSTVRPLRADLLPSIVTFRFYRSVHGTWVLRYERRAATDAVGVARTTFTFSQTGTWYVRAFAERTPYNAASRFTQREVFRVL